MIHKCPGAEISLKCQSRSSVMPTETGIQVFNSWIPARNMWEWRKFARISFAQQAVGIRPGEIEGDKWRSWDSK
jgi:hypothetical protein